MDVPNTQAPTPNAAPKETAMARELSKAYEPKQVEAKWYPEWENQGLFHAEVDPSRPAYCITIPPPNVTGELHLGHALQHSIHDLIIRRTRMQGFNALW